MSEALAIKEEEEDEREKKKGRELQQLRPTPSATPFFRAVSPPVDADRALPSPLVVESGRRGLPRWVFDRQRRFGDCYGSSVDKNLTMG